MIGIFEAVLISEPEILNNNVVATFKCGDGGNNMHKSMIRRMFILKDGLKHFRSELCARFIISVFQHYVATLQATHTFAHAHEGRKSIIGNDGYAIVVFLFFWYIVSVNSLVAKDVSKTVFSSMSWALFRTPTFLKKLEN
ncbi:hypothetical protein ACJX0J_039548 [Zea mays]